MPATRTKKKVAKKKAKNAPKRAKKKAAKKKVAKKRAGWKAATEDSKEILTTPQAIEALEKTAGLVTQAAKLLGVHRNTLSRFIGRHDEVQAALGEITEVKLDEAELAMDELIAARYWPAVAFYLRCKGRNRGYNLGVEVAGEIAVTVKEAAKQEISDNVTLLKATGKRVAKRYAEEMGGGAAPS